MAKADILATVPGYRMRGTHAWLRGRAALTKAEAAFGAMGAGYELAQARQSLKGSGAAAVAVSQASSNHRSS